MGNRVPVATLLLGLLSILGSPRAGARTVRYELVATRGEANLSGKGPVGFALMLNGGIPAPTLEFTEGDEAEIVVRNRLPGEELSLHWHGLLLPPDMDGVAYVNNPPIRGGESFTFRFKLRQSGTYWYHSHTDVQEQKGLYGAFVIHPKEKALAYDRDFVAVVSDWSDENATDILKNLRKDGDYYLYKKGTMRSWLGAVRAGGLGTFLGNEWTRMGGMDYSDVGYDAFLINGKRELRLPEAKPGETVRLRIINAAASTYFHVALGQAPMRVVSADGVDIEPRQAKEILIGMAETYDVLFKVPEGRSTELKATAQDGTGSASAWLGEGDPVAAPMKPRPDPYAPMSHGAHGGAHAGHGGHAAHGGHHGAHAAQPVIDTLTVDDLKAKRPTAFPGNARVHDVKLALGGDMNRYVWHINGKAIHQDRAIEIQEGDIVRFTFENGTMMHHPMHLHGHFFRVLNQYGESSPMKHTVDVSPRLTRVIEFRADEPGEWMLHCHNLYHLKTGMGRVVRYSSYTPSREIRRWQEHDPHLHDHWYSYGSLEAATNHAQAFVRASQTWNQLEARIEGRNTAGTHLSFKEPWEVEADLFYRRWLDQYLNLVAGAASFDRRGSAVAGAGYLLPMLVESELLIDHRGKLRLGLEKRFRWTASVFTDVDFTWRPAQAEGLGEPVEYEVSLMYSPAWSWAAGLMLTDDGLGAGLQARF